MIKYYFFLLFKKIRFNLHDYFEIKRDPNLNNSIEQFSVFLWSVLFSRLEFTDKSVFFNSKVNNKGKPLILSQARVLLALVESYHNKKSLVKAKWLIKAFSKYLISERRSDGLFSFNYPSWDRQDEGIATVWTVLALIKANSILDENSIHSFIEDTTNIMLDKLYTEDTSLLHTKNDTYWCLNSASTLAYVCKLLLDINYSERLEIAMNNSIDICIKNIHNDGHFPYSEKRKGTYILLYHPVVIYTLEMCENSEYLDDEIKIKLRNSLANARKFLIDQLDTNLYFVEPEVQKYSRYVISNIIGLVALKGYIDVDKEEKILKNILTFMRNHKLYLCINDDLKLYNSSLYKLKDQLSIEVLFWLEIYKAK